MESSCDMKPSLGRTIEARRPILTCAPFPVHAGLWPSVFLFDLAMITENANMRIDRGEEMQNFPHAEKNINKSMQYVDGGGAEGRWSPALFALGDENSWRSWRDAKLRRLEAEIGTSPTPIADSSALSDDERRSLLAQIAATNMALYEWRLTPPNDDALDVWLLAFTKSFGLRALEDHRSANRNGVVRIEVVQGGGRAGYIPYTNRRIAWHTDGYYNYHGPSRCVRAMILHCAEAAEQGGENRLLDHELAYLRLRDADPRALRRLMHPEAMIIPEAVDDAGGIRPVNVGPVFFLDDSGALAMRYTARKRYVEWRDEATREAAEHLHALIDAEPLARSVKLAPGQGVLCNNVLHDRTAFEDGGQCQRLLCRVRFHNRIDSHKEEKWRGSANLSSPIPK
jgi:hypothetical protein